MSPITVATVALMLWGPVWGAWDDPAADPAGRLLEAELLEVSSGDLDGAMNIYRTLVDADDTPETVRARALLYLARCHRKLGELQPARELLEDLVVRHPDDAELVAAAHSFLAELRAGRSDSERFDWMKEIETNPEIQARVFDLAMELIDADSDAAKRARTQLRALGTIAVPVLERICKTSRSVEHRQHLAIVLIEAGHYRYLKTLFELGVWRRPDVARELAEFAWRALPDLDPESREAFRGELGRAAPVHDYDGPPLACLRLLSGDLRHVETDLSTMITRHDSYYRVGQLVRRIADSQAGAEALARVIPGHPDIRPERLCEYTAVLLFKAPHLVTRELIRDVRERGRFDNRTPVSLVVERLVQNSRLELIHELAGDGSPWADAVALVAVSPETTLPVAERARICITAGEYRNAQILAEQHDEAIPVLVEFLRRRAEVAEEYRGASRMPSQVPSRPRRPTSRSTVTRRNRLALLWSPDDLEGWHPSHAYATTMASLLDDDDLVVRAIAIEALALADGGVGPDVTARLATMVESDPDDVVRSFAASALVRRVAAWPASGEMAARSVARFHERAIDDTTQEGYRSSPLFEPGDVHWVGYLSVRSGPDLWACALDTLSKVVDRRCAARFYDALLAQFVQGEGIRLYESWYQYQFRTAEPFPRGYNGRALVDRLDELKDPATRLAALPLLASTDGKNLTAAVPFAAAALTDAELPVAERVEAFREISGKLEPPNVLFEALPWEQLLSAEDPFCDLVMNRSSEQLRSWLSRSDHFLERRLAALKSPHMGVRHWARRNGAPDPAAIAAAQASSHPDNQAWAIGERPHDTGLLDLIDLSLRSDEPSVHEAARSRLLGIETIDALPLLLELLDSPLRASRLAAVERLPFFASEESLAPLVKRLDDDDFKVRAAALASLEAIKATLEKKEEWKRIVRPRGKGY